MKGQVSVEFLIVLLSSLSMLFISVAIANGMQRMAEGRMADEEERFVGMLLEDSVRYAKALGPGNKETIHIDLWRDHLVRVDGLDVNLSRGRNELVIVNNGSISIYRKRS